VHERALARRGRRRLGEPLDVRELERERALLNAAIELGESDGGIETPTCDGTAGCDTNGTSYVPAA
jgi:hypothetical protein